MTESFLQAQAHQPATSNTENDPPIVYGFPVFIMGQSSDGNE